MPTDCQNCLQKNMVKVKPNETPPFKKVIIICGMWLEANKGIGGKIISCIAYCDMRYFI
jgi:hypothetical protein